MKFVITSKERLNDHPINVVRTYLESFILYNDSGLNDVDNQLVEIEDVPEIANCIRTILDKGKENLPSSSEQTLDKVEKISEQPSKKVVENS